LVLRRGIEVGHIFKLGTRYSEPLQAQYLGEDGRARPLHMGCYGIGISRVAAAAVEQHADDKGIGWPATIAPFEAVVACMTAKEPELNQAAEQIYGALKEAGVDAMLDDRAMSPGAKLTDLELLGFPCVVLIGRTWKQEGKAELRIRKTGETRIVDPARVAPAVLETLRG